MQIGMCVGGSKLLPKKTPTLPNYADPNSKQIPEGDESLDSSEDGSRTGDKSEAGLRA